MDEVYLRHLSRWQAEQQGELFADMYVEAYGGAPGQEYPGRQDFLRRFTDDLRRPGFDMVVAGEGAAPVGCAYGYPPDRDGSWWQGLHGPLPPDVEELTASGRLFAVTELMVLPGHRRRNVATRLQDTLLTRTDAALATTLIAPANEAALSAYRKWSWTRTGTLQPPTGDPLLESWSRPLHR